MTGLVNGPVVLKVLVHGLALAVLFYFGFQVGQTALTDPDTCFLVAVGREILHGGIPAHDPFSWTGGASTYIVYQWLAALFFALLEKIGGALALTLLTGLAVALAFFLIPLMVSHQRSLAALPMLVVASLGFAAASFHFPCRPEIFSYVFLSFLIAIFSGRPIRHKLLPVLIFFIFSLWSNLHTGFILGLLLLFVLSSGAILSSVSAKTVENSERLEVFRPYATSFLAALFGSLANPYGIALFGYLPHLFFSRVNKYNLELLPLSAPELLSFDYWPLLLLLGLFIAAAIYAVRRQSFLFWSYLLLSVANLYCGIACRRLLPFAVLFLYGFFYVALAAGEKVETERAEKKLIAAALPFLLSALATVYAGLNCAALLFKPALPQTTFGFDSPQAAFNYLDQDGKPQARRPQGRLLNDPQFGDVMLLRYGPDARVFIDTRFDLYGDDLVLDFWNMANLRGDWQNLLTKYQIDWIFFPPRAPIVSKLREDKGWMQIYGDDQAVILKRLEQEK